MCPELKVPHGNVSPKGQVAYNVSVEIACQPGYRLIGPSSRECGPDGLWTKYNPDCVGK